MTTINANAITEANDQSAFKSRYGRTSLGKCATGLFGVAAGLLAVTGLAWGADLSLPRVAPVAPVPYTWTGIYVGLNAGYGDTKLAETASGAGFNGSASTNIPGGIGGVQIGANYQTGPIVLGAEADFDGTVATKSLTIAGIASNTAEVPWIGTLRARVGYAFDRLLLYATAGGAATQLISTVNVPAVGSSSTTFTHGGWTAGGGIEVAVTESLSARVEYLYIDTGNFDVAAIGGPPPVAVSGRIQSNLLRAGLNYRLPVAW